METKKMKIEYRKLTDNESDPWLLLTNIDELIWNGVYALRVIDDDGSLGLPFRFENDDTVTLVLKDHSHEGKLQSARTVVQTITRVERSSGKVFTYTRTRYCVDGKHRWNSWELAAEGEGGAVIPGLGQMLGDGLTIAADGKITIKDNAIDENKLSDELKQRVDSLVINSGITLNFGRLVEFQDEPDKTSTKCVYSEKIYSNGETITANAGYKIQSFKIWDEVQELWYQTGLNAVSYSMHEDIGYFFEIEFVKEDGSDFTAEEFPKVIKSFTRIPITWNEEKRIDSFVGRGDFYISGKRTKTNDGLPADINVNSTFNAHLNVLRCGDEIIQKLTIVSNRGIAHVYVRNGQYEDWGQWKELLTEIPDKSVTENKLGTDISAKIDTLAGKLSLADTLVTNSGITLGFGRLVEFQDEPDKTSNKRVYSEKIYSNGETITANAGYRIQSFKVWDEVQELWYQTDLNAVSYSMHEDIGYFFEIEFVKEDGSDFTAEEFPKVIKSFTRTPVTWDEEKRINSFVGQGNFHIRGIRTKTNDGLPTTTTGQFEARLTVLAGSETSVMQVLTLYYISTGEGNIYMRTLQGTTWSEWKSMFGE